MENKRIKEFEIKDLEKEISNLIKGAEMLFVSINFSGIRTSQFTITYSFLFSYDDFILLTSKTSYKVRYEWIDDVYIMDNELKIKFEENGYITIAPVN